MLQTIAFIIEKSSYSDIQYKKGEFILYQGDLYNDLIILIKGSCYGEIVDITGKTIKVEDFNPPAILAPAVLFATKNKMPGSVIAKADSSILKISKDNILAICSINKQFLANFLTLISNKFLFISNRMSFLSFKTIKGKLVKYILSLEDNPQTGTKLKHTIEELSDFFGVSRPSLSRVFMQLENEGILKKNNKIVTILDKKKLIKYGTT